MTIHTAIVKLVNENSDGIIITKNNTIRNVMENVNSVQRVYEFKDGSAPNAASDGDSTAPDIHDYLELEDSNGFSIDHIDQYFIITSD